jgi:hypothetical protein
MMECMVRLRWLWLLLVGLTWLTTRQAGATTRCDSETVSLIAANKPPLASVFKGHAPGQGFSGFFDPKTSAVLMKPSAYPGTGGALPEGFVSARGRHQTLSNELGRDVNHVGFTGFLDEGGGLRMEWLSRSVNGPNPSFPGPVVPQAMRPSILDAIKSATGRAAQ